jgi:inner membrane protein
MLTFAHVGITFGVAVAAETLVSPSGRAVTGSMCTRLRAQVHGRIVSLSHKVDLRLLLVASLLPDIIDKPIGFIIFPDVFGTGRLFAHTLAFPLALGLAGAWLYRSRRSLVLLTLAYGAAMHLILDAMWRSPVTLLWPLEGPLPHGGGADGWLAGVFATLMTNPAAYLPEIAGAILLVPFLWIVVGRKELGRFLRSGAVD